MGTPVDREGMRARLRAMLNEHTGAVAEIPFGTMEARA